MKLYDVLIVGGGAAGIFTAININRNKKVAIVEMSDRLGRKILATGNGRCNITNTNLDSKFYNTEKVAKYIDKFDTCKVVEFFSKIGLEIYSDNEGRCYPVSNSANSVLDVLIKQIELHDNIEVFCNTVCTDIIKKDEKFVITLNNNEKVICNKLVVATGGNAGKEYLDMLTVKYSEFVPSLVGLNTEKNKFLAGVRVSKVSVKFNNFIEQGEILFKENGISGIVIFNLSSMFARKNLQSGHIVVDLLPSYDKAKLENFINNCCKNNPKYLITEMLTGIMHKSLARNIIYRLGIKDTELSSLKNKEKSLLVKEIKEYTIKITGLSDNNQVYSGGVSLDNLTDTLEYVHCKNLYFVGEIVDVDGVCGGYNLQWAWTSGKIVGDNI